MRNIRINYTQDSWEVGSLLNNAVHLFPQSRNHVTLVTGVVAQLVTALTLQMCLSPKHRKAALCHKAGRTAHVYTINSVPLLRQLRRLEHGVLRRLLDLPPLL